MLDEKTARKLDEAFGDKLMISLSRFAALTGLARDTLEEYIAAGTLKAISSKTHIHVTRPMAVEFLTQGGGIESAPMPTLPPQPLSSLKRAAMRYAEKHRKRRRGT